MGNIKVPSSKGDKKIRYNPRYLTEIPYFTVKHGKITHAILATEIGCSEGTITAWRKKHPEFDEALKDPMKSALAQNYEKIIGNMIYGRTIIERDGEGNITKETTHPPTHQDLQVARNMGLIKTDRYAINQTTEHERQLKKEKAEYNRKTMMKHRNKYEQGKINLSQLLLAYDDEGIEPPPHIVKEHAAALVSGELSLVHEDDLYDKEHAERVLQAKRERQAAKDAELESAKAELAELKSQLAAHQASD